MPFQHSVCLYVIFTINLRYDEEISSRFKQRYGTFKQKWKFQTANYRTHIMHINIEADNRSHAYQRIDNRKSPARSYAGLSDEIRSFVSQEWQPDNSRSQEVTSIIQHGQHSKIRCIIFCHESIRLSVSVYAVLEESGKYRCVLE